MADACRAFDAPVVSGNASLYNESDDGPVLPTPVIGMLGLLARPELAVRSAFQSEGDIVILLGAGLEQSAASLGASEYLAVRHNLSAGPVEVDLDAERRLVDCLVEAAEAGLLRSAHDCSDGGLAVALAESAIAGAIGVQVAGELGARLDAALFGESGHRAIVTTSLESAAEPARPRRRSQRPPHRARPGRRRPDRDQRRDHHPGVSRGRRVGVGSPSASGHLAAPTEPARRAEPTVPSRPRRRSLADARR